MVYSPKLYAVDLRCAGLIKLIAMWYVYVLLSKKSSFFYVGSTNDITRRLGEHNRGEVQSTKAYLPYEMEAYIAVKSEKQARTLEKYFKTGSGRAVLFSRLLGMNPLAV